MTASQPCPLCGSSEHETVSEADRHGNPLKTVLCMGCGIITNDPIPTDEDLAAFYARDYRKEYKGTAEPRMRQVWRNFSRIETHMKRFRDVYSGRKTCLDLGSGSGEFMFMAQGLGIACKGIEPNEDYSAYSRNRLGLDVSTQTLEEADFRNGSFDLIRLSHVLEHMRDPVRSLKTLRKWLTDDGVLYIEVPDIAFDADHKMKGKMFHFGHIFNFNPVSLRYTASLAGFAEVPETVDRSAGTAGIFVRKMTGKKTEFDLTANAVAMKAAMDGHNTRALPKPAAGETALSRFLRMTSMRLGEMWNARRFRDHRAIAEHFRSRIA